MKLFRYSTFIKESKGEDIFQLNSDDIRSYFRDIELEGYKISISTMLCTEVEGGFHIINDDDDFYDVMPGDGDDFYVGYKVEFNVDHPGSGQDDVTSVFHESIRRILGEGYKLILVENNDGEDITKEFDHIYFQDGKIKNKYQPPTGGKSWDLYTTHLGVYLMQDYKLEANYKNFKEIFNWNGDYHIYVPIDHLSSTILKNNDGWERVLINGYEEIEDNYESYYYAPDGWHSLFRELDKENETLLLKCLIKESGGLETFIEECDDESLIGKNQQEVIDIILDDRYLNILDRFDISDFESSGDIRNLIADWYCSAHASQNLKEVYQAFDKIINQNFKDWERVMRERTIWSSSLKKNIIIECPHYKIGFDMVWLKSYSSLYDIHDIHVADMFGEWTTDELSRTETLDPYFSDYGDVNTKDMNSDIKMELESFLKD